MDKKELYKQVDHKRWLMNNSLFEDSVKNDLFFYGSICHPNVRAVDFSIDPEKRVVSYKVYLDEGDLRLVAKFRRLEQSQSFFGLWRFKRMLKKYGNLDPARNVDLAVKEFAGPSWGAVAEIFSINDYDPGPYKEEDSENFGPGADAYREINGG